MTRRKAPWNAPTSVDPYQASQTIRRTGVEDAVRRAADRAEETSRIRSERLARARKA